jgi:hypothetical protein
LLPRDHTCLLQLAQQLRDISFGHQQCIGQLLLGHPTRSPNLRQNIKMSSVQSMRAKEPLRACVDFLKHPRQA